MTIRYFPFNSIVTGGVADRAGNADDLSAYLDAVFKEGVLTKESTALQVTAGDAMTVQVLAGAGIINGKIFMMDSAETLTIEGSNATLNRIDRVVLRLDTDNRLMELGVLTGEPASEPVAPELTRTASIYELCLAEISVTAAAIDITSANITDTRGDAELCGAAQVVPLTLELETAIEKCNKIFDRKIEEVNSALGSLESVKGVAPYMAFVGNVNADMVDAAFGKNNEDNIGGIGMALAMYAKYKDPTIDIGTVFPNALMHDKLIDIINLREASIEVLSDANLATLIESSAYAMAEFENVKHGLPDLILYDKGVSDYLDLEAEPTIGGSASTQAYDLTSYDCLYARIVTATGQNKGGNLTVKIPFKKPLTIKEWIGYRKINIKFSDDYTSNFTLGGGNNSTFTSWIGIYLEDTLYKVCPKPAAINESAVVTGATKSLGGTLAYMLPFFDINTLTINLQGYGYNSSNAQTINAYIEKIWLSEE